MPRRRRNQGTKATERARPKTPPLSRPQSFNPVGPLYESVRTRGLRAAFPSRPAIAVAAPPLALSVLGLGDMDGRTNRALLGAIPPPPVPKKNAHAHASPPPSEYLPEDRSSGAGPVDRDIDQPMGRSPRVISSAVSYSRKLPKSSNKPRSGGITGKSWSALRSHDLRSPPPTPPRGPTNGRRMGLQSAPPSMLTSSCDSKNNNIRVVTRVRPINETERALGNEECIAVEGGSVRVVRASPTTRDDRPHALTTKEFSFFDSCVSAEQGQDAAFDEFGVPQLLDDALAGTNVTLFAYGQTGSGKTYTIHDGIIPRSLKYLFDRLVPAPLGECEAYAYAGRPATARMTTGRDADAPSGANSGICGVSFSEIYNDAVYDLILCNNRPLKLKWDAGEGFHAPDIHIQPCNTLQDALAVLNLGNKRRRQRSHSLNAESSRSHAILTMYLFHPGGMDPQTDSIHLMDSKYSKVHFVDLAGSERLKESGNNNAEDVTIRETANINKSLFLLGNVICAIATGQPKERIPYRDTKLTKMLFGSMVHPSKCLMIACCSPSHSAVEESLTTLAYASRFASAPAIPIVRVDREAIVIASLRRENRLLKEELRILRGG